MKRYIKSTQDWRVRYAIASNPNTSQEDLDKLSYDREWEVLHAVCSNPNTSPETLRKLASRNWGGSTDELELIAVNPNTPGDVLEKLADSVYYTVRDAIASNPNFDGNI